MLYAVKIGDQTYSVEIDDLDSRPVVVSVDGEKMEVWPEEHASKTAAATVNQVAGMEQTAPMPEHKKPDGSGQAQPAAGRSVAAPIPGVIVEIRVAVGQSVNRGDELCVLEAMKMKNSIKAGRAGTIGAVNIAVGDQVRHGHILMEFTD
jgi:glutaconyl-CoA/methylmalonyl-CoA decarboxylase subunit gamma